ncbi:ImmA/IrrE family metallo-endopeptidase [Lactococcus paracarnosus]|uniref:ImmA/IrrE family metallo-endopeptidase n=1 Tax=Pseudolactococcus paracarnosus TaxID=2749962 RepID=A0ABT0API6_9LACT|nr:ImmA/IrrE family metallo-endopeptidase [Lactococcus paracarnosus]MCJ1978440.1 ImmA/IrrE family metallo-endopeptidase [Lactococcus paracarnosus]MCJ1984581.1 ImmA/IrrE family metallo-endopeptidase [Lactococcus paracarnosus]MCJ1999214.1 ImmA/IrrE family metallo-endopeptidase [Lactococcus paracarnosus]
MLSRIKQQVKELGIEIQYMEMISNGYFGIEDDDPIVFINDNLNEIDTALALLHETAHFLNKDCEKCVTNHFQNDNLEYEANKYMIHEVLKALDNEHDFTPRTNYHLIIENLDLPYHLDEVIIDEFYNLIINKFNISDDDDWENYQ